MIWFAKGGWWLPDGEEHLQQWMLKVNDPLGGRLTYQHHKYMAALPLVARPRKIALDIGAHVGLWSWMMARDFEYVIGFEPVPQHAECWLLNVRNMGDKMTLHQVALGDHEGEVELATRTEGSSGDTGVVPVGSLETAHHRAIMRPLDYYDFDHVSFVKIDCEGYEKFVIDGGHTTLLRNKPVMVIEQKPETGMEARYGVTTTQAVVEMQKLGAHVRRKIQGDYIMSW